MIQLGFEPKTYCLEGSCSIQLSYWTSFNFPAMYPEIVSGGYRTIKLEKVEGFPSTFSVGVGAAGFEPTTPWSQTRCATGLRHAPNLSINKIRRLFFFCLGLLKLGDPHIQDYARKMSSIRFVKAFLQQF